MGQRLVVGLGNPGPEYENTWHNLGFQAVRRLAARMRTSLKSRRDILFGRGRIGGHDVFLVLPQTYMNRSGEAVARVMKEQRIDHDELLVIFDDHDLPLGQLRLRAAGGDGGHRGMRSVIHEVGLDRFARLRIGIRDETVDEQVGGYEDLADRVLQPLSEEQREHFDAMAQAAARVAQDWASLGVQVAMNRHNGLRVEPPRQGEKKGKGKDTTG